MRWEERWPFVVWLAAVLAVVGYLYLFFTAQVKEPEPLRVGLILPGARTEVGWYKDAYLGLEAATEEVGAELLVEEYVPDSIEGLAAVDRLHQAGAGLILSATYGYGELFSEARHKYPDTTFYTILPFRHEGNLRTYFVRIYQLRYLQGILAGLKTKTGRIGFVSVAQSPDGVHEVDAFALGARRVNPEAVVVSGWLGGEADTDEHARQMAAAMVDKAGVDVLVSHRVNDAVAEAAVEKGAYALASYDYLPQDKHILSQQNFSWQTVWFQLIKDCARNSNMRAFYWFDYERAGLRFEIVSPEVTEAERALLEKAEQELKDGFEPFAGEIRDNQGELRCLPGEYLSDYQLRQSINWFVEGVENYAE